MKTHNSKKQRRKIVSVCYRKRSHSVSNTSLSRLLSVGSYKKHIKDVLKNNRSLAVNLQEARLLVSTQSDIIKKYGRDYNKIMFARLKLQGMAKTITQLVTDLHDVVNCLDVNWESENNLFQNGIPHEKMKMRSPDVDIIEEEPEISSEKEDCGENEFSCSNSASNEASSPKASNIEILPGTPENITDVADDLDMPPILFVDDNNDNPGEKLSRERKSSRKSVVNQISLTPELDPDIYVWPKRRSSSRKQVIIPSVASSSRSNRRSSFCRQLSIEKTTPKRGLETTAQRKLSLNLVNHKDSHENKSPDMAIFNTEECEVFSSSDLHCKKYSDQNEFSDCTFVNMKDRGSKNKNSSSPDIPEHFVDPNFPNVLPSEPVFASDSVNNNIINNVESNNTILPCEDMELTDIIRPVQLIVSENPSNTVKNLLSHTVLHSNKPEKKEEIIMDVQEIHSEDKLCNATEQISVLKDVHLNVEEKSCDSAKVSDCEETSRNTESVNNNPSESPVKSSRIKKRTYSVFFTSSESESDSTPIKSKSNKKKSNKDHRSTVIFKHKLSKRISDKEDKDVGADKSPTKNLQEIKDMENRYAVYELDVSNSKKPLKKSKPRSKPKNSCNKETSKPLLQNCNITKLPGVNYKFTKNKNPVNEKQTCQFLQNDSLISETNPAIHTDRIINKNQTYFTFDSTGLETEVENKQTSIYTRDELSSENTDLENPELCSKASKLETRRVSFASVDLVCNFNKMSQARTIADNKKTLRTSKSAVNLDNFNQPPSETKDDALFETNKSSDETVETPHSPSNFNKMSQARTIAGNKKTLCTSKSAVNLDNFNQPPSGTKDDALFKTNKSSDGTAETPPSPSTLLNCSEETELYTFVLPVAEVEKLSSYETTASHLPTVSDSSSNPNSKSSTKKKSGKLSLKKSKNCQNKPELDSYDKTDKDILLKLHHSQPSENSHKVLSYDSLNKNLEHVNSQTLEHTHKDVQIETQTSKKLHVTPIENNLIPIDDIKISKKSNKKSGSSLKHKSPLPRPDKTSKSSNTSKKFSESSPVLKDVLNLEENSRQSMKRRQSKAVNYKEPSGRKKLRRD